MRYVPPIHTQKPKMVRRSARKRFAFQMEMSCVQHRYMSPGMTSIISDPNSDPLNPMTTSTSSANTATVHVHRRTPIAVLDVSHCAKTYVSLSFTFWKSIDWQNSV